jgi:hypothetical protein
VHELLRGEPDLTIAELRHRLEWPVGPSGQLFPIQGTVLMAVVFKNGNVATAKEFVRFLVAEGWLMHYLNFSGERMLPSNSKLLDQPFWLDPSDPHRILGDAGQLATAGPQPTLWRPVTGGTSGRFGERLGQGRPTRRCRRHQPRTGG